MAENNVFKELFLGAAVFRAKEINFDPVQATAASTENISRYTTISGLPRKVDRGPPKPRALLSGAELSCGYVAENAFVDALYNRGIAALLLILSLPVFAIVVVLIVLTSPGPVFYRGKRLGRDRQEFFMFKFRTLEDAASRATADKTLPRRNMMETPIGAYLRASRLDELPQLLNIVRGEMVFFGPRPIRPELEVLYAAEAPGYERRFAVRPGLVGIAQALMTHETHKSIRARVNSMCVRRKTDYLRQSLFIAYVAFCVLRRTAMVALQAMSDLISPGGQQKFLRSGFANPPKARLEIEMDGATRPALLCGISDEVLQFVSTQPFPPGSYRVQLVRRLGGKRLRRVNTTVRVLNVAPVGIGRSGFAHFATYQVDSGYARYIIERYFLRSAVVST